MFNLREELPETGEAESRLNAPDAEPRPGGAYLPVSSTEIFHCGSLPVPELAPSRKHIPRFKSKMSP